MLNVGALFNHVPKGAVHNLFNTYWRGKEQWGWAGSQSKPVLERWAWSQDLCSLEPVFGVLKGAGRKQELNVFEFCTLFVQKVCI